jgi:hypothetical protein
MKNNLLTALRLIIVHIASAAAITLCYSASGFAKNNCDSHATTINPAITTHAESGIGGTGITAAGSGIGGTGVHEGGIGGTGNLAGGIGGTGQVASDGGIGGTGIIGIITGFASICVNGIEVHYDNTTPVQVDGRSATIRDLAAGQLIAVQALGGGQELTARQIAIIHAAAGPISSVDHEKGEIRILNQAVQITRLEDRGSLSALKTGDWVQVSGHRLTSGAIIASRIEAIPPRLEAKLTGYITHIDSQGFEVNGTRVDYSTQPATANISRGMEIAVAGHWNGASLHAEHLALEPTRQSIGNVQHIVIEGYIHALDDKAISLGNRIVTLDSSSQIAGASRSDLRPDQRIQMTGQVGSDQRITPERIEMKQEQPLHLEQRIDHGAAGNDHQNPQKSSKTEPELKSADGDKDEKDRSGKDSDQKNSGHDGLKKETDQHSDNNRDSSDQSRSKDHDAPSGDEKESSRPESPEPLKPAGNTQHETRDISDNSIFEKLEKTSDSLRDSDNPDRIDRDHSLPADRDSGHRDTDHLPDNVRDMDIRESVRDRPDQHDRDPGHRDIDHIRDQVRDMDIRENVRDRSDHLDRDFGPRDRDFDR